MDTSRDETGSSQMRRMGSTARARAIPMRCRWPPENAEARRREVGPLQAHQFEQLDNSGTALLGRLDELVDADALADDVLDLHAGVERRVGVLEDDLHLAAECFELGALDVDDVLPLDVDTAGVGLGEADDAAGSCRLPGTGLADQADDRSALHLETHIVDGTEVLSAA